jgi:2',3'-cyclic-nucleotide 2'-phosphodiesterase (5'-nucleotidase family)
MADSKLQIITAFIIFSLLLLHSIPSFSQEVSLTLIYSSNTLSEVESGCCPETGNAGGLARRSHTIKAVSKEVKNRLILDAGDTFAIGLPARGKETEKARKRGEFILKIYEKMGYDAINIGDTDLVLGVHYLTALSKKSKIPFISANLREKKTGQPVFEPYRIKQVNGSKIGIIGLLTPHLPPYLHKEMIGYIVEDPIKMAIEMTNGPMSHCDHIIALAHLNMMEIEELAQKVPRIPIIIGGNDRSFVFPKQIHSSLWTQTDAFGLHIGRMNLGLKTGAKEFVDVLPGKSSRVPDTGGVNTYENHLILLHPGMESDPEIEKLISSSRDLLKRPLP